MGRISFTKASRQVNSPKSTVLRSGTQKAINKWDRATKTFIPLTDEEIDAIDAQLYTLADCEHKESEVRDYDGILESYEKKNGSPLGADEGIVLRSGMSSVGVQTGDATTILQKNDTSFTPNTESVANEVSDQDEYFANLANM